MPKFIEFMLEMFMVSICAAVVLFSLPFALGDRKGEALGAVATGTRCKLPEAETVWGGIALVACCVYVVALQGANLKALAMGIGLAIGILPA
jgi:hypothetical protein